MAVKCEPLDALLNALRAGEAQFVATYPGLFLLPMGRLAVAHELPRRAPPPAEPAAERPGSSRLRAAFAGPLRPTKTAGVDLGPTPRMAIATHPLAGLVFFLRFSDDGEKLFLGRDGSCDIVVPDDSVSLRHCSVRAQRGGLVVADLCSTNGTMLDRKRLTTGTRAEIPEGAVLTVGRYSFHVYTARALFRDLAATHG